MYSNSIPYFFAEKDEAMSQSKPIDRRYGNERPPAPSDGLSFQAWALFYELAFVNGEPPSRQLALQEGEKRGLNPGNIGVELGSWRKFHKVPGERG